jgi:hypothetical protein
MQTREKYFQVNSSKSSSVAFMLNVIQPTILRRITHFAISGGILVFLCFHILVSCEVLAKNRIFQNTLIVSTNDKKTTERWQKNVSV